MTALTRYRILVLLLAGGYWLYQFRGFADGGPGWQFRYLTIWALTASLLSAAAMLRHDRGRGAPPFVLASVAAVLNALVVLLYWRLYFIDPALVNGDKGIAWWQEYYLHLAGPVLQWIDALILFGAFRRPAPTLAALSLTFLAYLGWAEGVVAPFNAKPAGDVTAGLPYPFLNDMELPARLAFYGQTFVTMLAFLGLGFALERARGWLRRGRDAARRG